MVAHVSRHPVKIIPLFSNLIHGNFYKKALMISRKFQGIKKKKINALKSFNLTRLSRLCFFFFFFFFLVFFLRIKVQNVYFCLSLDPGVFQGKFLKVLDQKDKVTFIKSVVKEFSNKTFYLYDIGFLLVPLKLSPF